MTYAVIRLGGRQFKVSEGEVIKLERQASDKNEVLLYSDGKNVAIGDPVLTNIEVVLKNLEDRRDRKVRIGRFKGKSRYRKIRGHKQPLSVFSVEKIGEKGKKAAVEEKKVEVKPSAAKKRGRPAKKKEE